MSITLYGLPNCDTCRKARNWLDRHGIGHAFVDYRTQRPEPEPCATGRARPAAGTSW